MVVRLGTMIIVIIGEAARVLMMVGGSGRKGERSRGGVGSKRGERGQETRRRRARWVDGRRNGGI
jgi:hypothetical protein